MTKNKKLTDLMVPIKDYPVIYDSDTIGNAISVLTKFYISGKECRSILVFSKTRKVNNEEELVGILTVRDILNTLKKNTMSYDFYELLRMSVDDIKQKKSMEESFSIKVGEAIRPLVNAHLKVDQSIEDALRLMMGKNVNILAIFDGYKPVGIIRALDVLEYIGEMFNDIKKL